MPCSAYLSSSSLRIWRASGPYSSKKSLRPVRTLAASAERGVEGDVAEQVERIGFRVSSGFGQMFEVDAATGELLDQFIAGGRIGPAVVKLAKAAGKRANLLGRVIAVLDDAKLIAVDV